MLSYTHKLLFHRQDIVGANNVLVPAPAKRNVWHDAHPICSNRFFLEHFHIQVFHDIIWYVQVVAESSCVSMIRSAAISVQNPYSTKAITAPMQQEPWR
jgi:hypothetical protein